MVNHWKKAKVYYTHNEYHQKEMISKNSQHLITIPLKWL